MIKILFTYELMLKKALFNIYEEKLKVDFGLKLGEVAQYKKEISPIIYASILNKKILNKNRRVEISGSFSVPEEYKSDWVLLKADIDSGADLSKYMSKDVTFWNKVDYLLFSCGITHLHFKTRNGRGIGDGLIFCVVNDECIYILSCGVHHDLYRPDDLVNIAETNWPGEVFGDVDEISKVENYNKRQANDPSLQYNMLKPLNVLSGPRHTVTATLNESDGEINHVPMLAFCAYENELKYLEKIENDFTEKYGLAVKLKMNIDFSKRKYLIKTGFPFQLPYEIDFSSDTTCSGLVSDSFL